MTTLSPQRLDKAAEALRQLEQGGKKLNGWDTLPNSTKKKWCDKASVVVSAYLGDTHVDVPREPTNETLDAIVEECMAAWGVNSGGKEKPRPIMWKSEWRERARPFYRAMLSASLLPQKDG